MIFKLFIQTLTASEKWEISFSSFSISEELNNDRSMSFAVDYPMLKAVADASGVTAEYILSASYREVYLLDSTNTIIYSGYISDITETEAENDGGIFTIQSKGFLSLLAKRLTPASIIYTGIDISAIVKDLIDYTQALSFGSLGIVSPTVIATRAMSLEFHNDILKDALLKMTNNARANAIDLEIDNNKNVNMYYPLKGSAQNNIILEYGFNIDSYNIRHIFIDGMCNQVTVVGGNDATGTQTVSLQNASDTYKSNFFLLQDKISESTVINQTELDNAGIKYLSNYQAPQNLIALTHNYESPSYTSYNLGDYLHIKIPKKSIDGFYRVIKRQVNDKSIVSLTFYPI